MKPLPQARSMTMPATARAKRWAPAEVEAAGLASRLSTVPSRTAAGSTRRGGSKRAVVATLLSLLV
jgi:hypothetical protein